MAQHAEWFIPLQEPMLLLLLLVALVAGAYLLQHKARERWERLVEGLVSRYGGAPSLAEPTWREPFRPWSGVVHGVPVTVDTVVVAVGKNVARFVRVQAKGTPPEVSIRAEQMLSRLKQAFAGADIQTGDADFDRAVYLNGPLLPTLARCHHPQRATIRAAVGLGATASGGGWTWQSRGTDIEPASLHRVIDALVANTRQWLDQGASTAEGLAHIVLHDPVDGARSHALSALLTVGGVEGALPTALEALGDTAWAAVLRPGAASPHALTRGVAAAVCATAQGGADVVLGLRAWEEIAPPALQPTFTRAIAAIHARVDPELRGGLSVASTAVGGELSPAITRGDLRQAQ